MRQFRYIIKGVACGWQFLNTPAIQLERIATRLTEWYGNNWTLEYREVDLDI